LKVADYAILATAQSSDSKTRMPASDAPGFDGWRIEPEEFIERRI